MCIRDRRYGLHQRTERARVGHEERILEAVHIAIRIGGAGAVSYTHPTPPTSDLVEISVVGGGLKKKKKVKLPVRGASVIKAQKS